MTWIIRVAGQEVTSDDFTLSELEVVEKQTDVPWSVANPLRSVAVARAFLKVAVGRTGGNPQDVDSWTLKQIKGLFDYREDEPFEEGGEQQSDPPPLDLSSVASLPGASAPTTGPRKKRAANG